MFEAKLSDGGEDVVLFYDDGKIEEMSLFDFTVAYGDDILWEQRECQTVLRPDVIVHRADDTKHYWAAFRRLVDICGKYEHDRKLLENALDGSFKAQKVADEYFSDGKLAAKVQAISGMRYTAVMNLDYWSRRVGYKKMSTKYDKLPEDVRPDVEILLDYLQYEFFRKRLRYRIDKCVRDGELKSAAELVTEVLESLRKNPPKSS